MIDPMFEIVDAFARIWRIVAEMLDDCSYNV